MTDGASDLRVVVSVIGALLLIGLALYAGLLAATRVGERPALFSERSWGEHVGTCEQVDAMERERIALRSQPLPVPVLTTNDNEPDPWMPLGEVSNRVVEDIEADRARGRVLEAAGERLIARAKRGLA